VNATHAVEEIVLSYVYRYRAHGSWLGPLPPAHNARRVCAAAQADHRSTQSQPSLPRPATRGAIDEGWLRDVDPYIVQLFAAMLHRLGSSYETAEATHLEDLAHENLRLVFEGLAPAAPQIGNIMSASQASTRACGRLGHAGDTLSSCHASSFASSAVTMSGRSA
jgi:hypothetical protein